jgi:hypothetical protein
MNITSNASNAQKDGNEDRMLANFLISSKESHDLPQRGTGDTILVPSIS